MAKRYKCPYCEERHERSKLIIHVEEDHDDLIPEKETPTQVVFNSINKKTHGTCVVCKKNTAWNEKAGKYDRLCTNPKCREKLREEFKTNATNKRGTYNFAADPEFQEKMLKGRKISSTYKFTDGGKVDYVGSYEKKFLEFCDKVLEIESKDIIGPGPIIEYEFDGETHHWITDFYYVPGNLVLDIKDGGSNPNTRPMEEYREKQIAKEKAIKKMKKYNYLRLTDNDFSQFMEVLADLKYMALDLSEKRIITQINEQAIEERANIINGFEVAHDLKKSQMTIDAFKKYSPLPSFMLDDLDDIKIGELNSMSAEDGYDSILKMFPEYLDIHKLKELQKQIEVMGDSITTAYKNLVCGEVLECAFLFSDEIKKYDDSNDIDKYIYDKFPGILAYITHDIREMVDMDFNSKVIKEYILTNYFPEEINDPKYVKKIINLRLKYNESIIEALKSMLKINYSILEIKQYESEKYIEELINNPSNGIPQIRNLIKNNSKKFIKYNSIIDFRVLGGGIVYGPKNFERLEKFIKPERLILYALKYDAILLAHGGYEEDIDIQPVCMMDGHTTVNTVVDFLKVLRDNDLKNKQGRKNILLLNCNPAHQKLSDEFLNTFDDDWYITMAMNSIMAESVVISNNQVNYPEEILEAEIFLENFCNENDIDYNDTQALQESYEFISYNLEIIEEGRILDFIKAFAKKVLKAIIYIWKMMINFFKKIFQSIMNFFEFIKSSVSSLRIKNKPVETSYITLESANVKNVRVPSVEDLEKLIAKSYNSISKEIKYRSQQQTKFMKDMERKINSGQIKMFEESVVEELSAAMATVPPQWANDANVMITNNMAGESKIALSSLDFNDSVLIDDEYEGIKKISKKEFKENYTIKEQFLYHKGLKYYNLLEAFKNNDGNIFAGIYCNLSSFDTVLTEDQIYFDKEFRKLKNKGVDQNVLDLSKRIEKVNDVLELDIKDDSIGITLPRMALDDDLEFESILRNGKTATKVKLNNSVIATFDKTTTELGIKDYEDIKEAANILGGEIIE